MRCHTFLANGVTERMNNMGRQYKGLTNKITLKFTDADLSRISRYGLRKHEAFSYSDVIRELCARGTLAGELSDVIENKIADLEEVAKIFDDVPGCEVAARAVREAACVMKVLRDWG